MSTLELEPTLFDGRYFSSDTNQDPYDLYEILRDSRPAPWSERMQAWVLSRYDDVSEAYKSRSIGQGDRTRGYVRKLSPADQEELHPLCPYMPRFISFLDPPEHRRQRDLVGRVFRPKTIEAMRSVIQNRVDELLDRTVVSGEMDAVRELALPLASLTASELVGVPPELRSEFIERVLVIFAFLGSDHTSATLARSAKDAYSGITAEMLSRLRGPAAVEDDDLVSQLGRLFRAGEVTESDACGILVGLVQGGFETTTSLISTAVFTLLRHPAELSRVRQQMELLPAAIAEVLRYDGPFKYVMRQAYSDVDIGGQTIRSGEQVMLMLGAANRDGTVFEEPSVFDVGRVSKTNVGFGLGLHFCLGAPLARLQAELAVGTLISRFDRLQLALPPASYHWKESALLRQLVAVPVRF